MPRGIAKNPKEKSRKLSEKLKGNKNSLGAKRSEKTREKLRKNHNSRSTLNLTPEFGLKQGILLGIKIEELKRNVCFVKRNFRLYFLVKMLLNFVPKNVMVYLLKVGIFLKNIKLKLA